jgi:hypothetical protein
LKIRAGFDKKVNGGKKYTTSQLGKLQRLGSKRMFVKSGRQNNIFQTPWRTVSRHSACSAHA